LIELAAARASEKRFPRRQLAGPAISAPDEFEMTLAGTDVDSLVTTQKGNSRENNI
jgi:hypothetical protein